MAGTCITTIKVIGVASLGLLSLSLAYLSFNATPRIIDYLSFKIGVVSDKTVSGVKSTVVNALVLNAALSGLATGLFTLAFKCSPSNEKHPYLIYSAIGGFLSVGAVAIKGYKRGLALLNDPKVSEISPRSTQRERSNSQDEDEESQLGKSYIHVSDEDSTASTPSPVTSPPGSPQSKADDSDNVDFEVQNALIKRKIIDGLKDINSAYYIGTAISVTSLLISVIGLAGDFIL